MRIFITGASRGIGAALLDACRARGADVISTVRERPGTDQLRLDVTDPAAFANIASELDGKPLDLLICNAGTLLDREAALETGYAPDLWARSFATNVTGVFLTVQTLLPNLHAARGKIAILSSQLGSTTNASGGLYAYRASKAAVLNLGRNLAADLKPEGLSVGIYHPGWVRTDMGGRSATISPEDSATGLLARFDALTVETTGCFEAWDGSALPF